MKKTFFVIGIIFLLIGASVVSSTGNVAKDISADCSHLKSVHSLEEKFSPDTTWYMFIVYGPEGAGFYAFYPNGTYRFGEWDGDGFFSGGTWTNDGRYLCCMYENGTLYDIDPETLDAYAIGDGGVSLNGLAYDPVTGKLYGASSYDLYEIDIESGYQTYIGSFGSGPNIMIAIAFDADGVLYGWDVGTDSLWIIDTDTGDATLVGQLGINLNYAQDGAFDYETDILYLVAYTTSSQLYECDEDTGECYLIGSLQWEATALAISYEYDDTTPPETTHSLDPPEPDGWNGWYVSDVNVTLTATDDLSGVKEIRYRIDGGVVHVIPGDNGSFNLSEDGEDILVEFWAVDNAGNVETPKHEFEVDIDQTPPDIDLTYEIIGGNWLTGWEITFTVIATDAMSGICRVEFYFNDELMETVVGPGPGYSWSLRYWPIPGGSFKVVVYDCAGNYAEAFVNSSDIKSFSRGNLVNRYSNNVWPLRFLERFPLSEVVVSRIINL